jgi:hypothetical protein
LALPSTGGAFSRIFVDVLPNKKFLYLAFGKAQADEAKQMPPDQSFGA